MMCSIWSLTPSVSTATQSTLRSVPAVDGQLFYSVSRFFRGRRSHGAGGGQRRPRPLPPLSAALRRGGHHPLMGHLSSLNAAAATAIGYFEVARHRQGARD